MRWERKNELMPRQGFCPVCCSGLFGSVAFPGDGNGALPAASGGDLHHAVVVPVSLRWVRVHMSEEYARHDGHAELPRERIDGAIGL
jgi:hypothetical protein